MWEFSSAGRASVLQTEGHRFEPCNSHHFLKNAAFFAVEYRNGFVVQLVRTPPCHGGGRGFESHRSRHLFAVLAHLVERNLAKVEVAGSSPVYRSIKILIRKNGDFYVLFFAFASFRPCAYLLRTSSPCTVPARYFFSKKQIILFPISVLQPECAFYAFRCGFSV